MTSTQLHYARPIVFTESNAEAFFMRGRVCLTARTLAKCQPEEIVEILGEAMQRATDEGLNEVVVEDVLFYDQAGKYMNGTNLNVLFDIFDGYLQLAAEASGLHSTNKLSVRFGAQYDVRCVITRMPLELDEFEGGYLHAS